MQSQLIESIITKDVIRKILNNPKSANHYCILIHEKLNLPKNSCCAELLRCIDTTDSIKVKIRNAVSDDYKNHVLQNNAKKKGEGYSKVRTIVKYLKKIKNSVSDEDWQRALYESHIIRELEKEKNKDA